MIKAKPYSVAFGKAIKLERTRQALSQEDLALRCDLDRTYISGIERGVRNPTLQAAWMIATVGLKLTLPALIKATEQLLVQDELRKANTPQS